MLRLWSQRALGLNFYAFFKGPNRPFIGNTLHERRAQFLMFDSDSLKKKKDFIYLFVGLGSLLLRGPLSSCGERGLLSSFSAQASHCGVFSCFGAQALTWEGFCSCDSQLQSTGSIIAAPGLSCSMACGIFVIQGSNLCLLHWQADSLLLSHQGSPSSFLFLFYFVEV